MYFATCWLRTVLYVDFDGVRLRDLTKQTWIGWDDIEAFSINDPADRTPFMLNFWPWRDQAQLLLTSGESMRVRAIEPRHGFTVLTLVMIRGVTGDRQGSDRGVAEPLRAHAP